MLSLKYVWCQSSAFCPIYHLLVSLSLYPVIWGLEVVEILLSLKYVRRESSAFCTIYHPLFLFPSSPPPIRQDLKLLQSSGDTIKPEVYLISFLHDLSPPCFSPPMTPPPPIQLYGDLRLLQSSGDSYC